MLTSGDLRQRSVMTWMTRRHLPFLARHINPRRAANLALLLGEMMSGRDGVRSHPFYLRIEVSPYCSLRCPGCMMGDMDLTESSPEHRRSGMMDYQTFVASVEPLVPWLLKVNLYDEGEPLLNKRIYDMVRYLSHHDVGSCISSNFSLPLSDDTLHELVHCGLEHLVVSLDGATQETYSRYRKGGKLSLVVENVRRLQRLLDASPSSKLKIELQFLDFGDNSAEQEDVRALAESLGVWRFTAIEGCSREGWVGVHFPGTAAERREKGCYHLWAATTVNSAGEMGTCDFGEDHGLPNIGAASRYGASGLRNHPSMRRLRASFRADGPPLHEVCQNCNQYRKF